MTDFAFFAILFLATLLTRFLPFMIPKRFAKCFDRDLFSLYLPTFILGFLFVYSFCGNLQIYEAWQLGLGVMVCSLVHLFGKNFVLSIISGGAVFLISVNLLI